MQRRLNSSRLETTRSASDNDVTILFKKAEIYVKSEMYEMASLCLQEAHSRLQDNILVRFKEWVQVIKLLVFCYCKSDKFHEAEELLNLMAQETGNLQFYGGAKDRAKVVCELGYTVIHKLLLKNSLEAAERLALKIIETGEQNSILASDAERSLAEIYRRQRKFPEAVEHCKKSIIREGFEQIGRSEAEAESEGRLLLALIYFTASDIPNYVVREAHLSDADKRK